MPAGDPATNRLGLRAMGLLNHANIFGNDDDREQRTKMEKEIFALKHKAIRSLDDGLLQHEFRGWALIHNGLHLEGKCPLL